MTITYDKFRRSPWKAAVWGRLCQADADVKQALSAQGWRLREDGARSIDAVDASRPLMVAADAIVRETYQFMDRAMDCLRPSGRIARVWDFLSGQVLMSAYLNLHMAEQKRVLLFSADQLTASLPSIRARVVAYLPPDDARRVALEAVPDIYAPPYQALVARAAIPPGATAAGHPGAAGQHGNLALVHPGAAGQAGAAAAAPLDADQAVETVRLTPMLGRDQRIAAEALTAAHTSEDQQQEQVKRFRSVLFGTFASLLIVVGILALVGMFRATIIPLCPVRTGAEAGSLICPSGATAPSAADLPLVLGLGAVGAALAVARNLTRLRSAGVRYSLSVAQGLVKIALGAVTAVLGLLILQTQTDLPGVLGTQQALLASAVIFGYGQQLFTGLIDRQASSLMDAASPTSPAR